jgi:hypothetical protein
MAFESLSERYTFIVPNFPEEWLPLIHLYDPDLPLFPLLYLHFLDPSLPPGARPGERDRIFGFVHHINFSDGNLSVSVAINKDLRRSRNRHLREPLKAEVRSRLGVSDPIRLADLKGKLTGALNPANKLVEELWYRIIDQQFGRSLPFGRMWDGVFGLVRFIASWNSDKGRKGELIQTHYFASAFGERIATGSGIHVDFYLLPTFEELVSTGNPLNLFPKFASLIHAADAFVARFCDLRRVADRSFSAFRRKAAGISGQLNTAAIEEIFSRFPEPDRAALYGNYTAFYRGPARSVISLLMLHDLRHSHWDPRVLTPDVCAEMYRALKGSYQTPKVIQLYAQQCFACECALPIDTWVKTFLKWPFGLSSATGPSFHAEIFRCSSAWGKLERVIWMASQARKVHSVAGAEILWCIRFGGPDKELRGANPFSCKACETHVRAVCPAYAMISAKSVHFNVRTGPADGFLVKSVRGRNSPRGQTFESCKARGLFDKHTIRDRPEKFKAFPAAGHNGDPLTVEKFIEEY